MPIKLADVIENVNSSYPVIDLSENADSTNSPIKGIGIFGSAGDWASWGSTNLQTPGYLSIVQPGAGKFNAYLYRGNGLSWGAGASHHEIFHTSSYTDLFTPTGFAAATADTASESIGETLADHLDEVTFVARINSSQGVRHLTLRNIIEAITNDIVNNYVADGYGSVGSYGGSVGSGGSPGDFNGDGVIATDDLIAMLGLLGQTVPGTQYGKKYFTFEADEIDGDISITGVTSAVTYFGVAVAGTSANTGDVPAGASTVSVTVTTADDFVTFSDGSDLEIAAGGSGLYGFGLAYSGLWGIDYTGAGAALIFIWLTVGRKVSGAWTDHTMLIGKFQVGFEDQTLTDNFGTFTPSGAYVPGAVPFTQVPVGINQAFDPAASWPAGNGQGIDLVAAWEEAAGTDFWVSDVQEVRMRWGYNHSSSATGSNIVIKPESWTVSFGTNIIDTVING